MATTPTPVVFHKMFQVVRNNPNLLTTYIDDLLIHDRRIIEAAGEENITFFWFPYRDGTHLLQVETDSEVKINLNLVAQIYDDFPGVEGYIVNTGDNLVKAITRKEIFEYARQLI